MTKKFSRNYWRDKLNLSRLAIKYSWLTICIWLGICVAGIFAFSSLKYALFPDITFPVVVVQTSAQINTALDTENQVTIPLENTLKKLEHLDEITASSYPGQGIVTLYFDPGINLKKATNLVETNLKKIQLPTDAKSEVMPFNLNESTAISYVVQGEQNLRELTAITEEKIIPELKKITGVLKVNLLGNSQASSHSKFLTLVRFNGQNAIAFQVIKESKANTLEVVKKVNQIVTNLQAKLPNIQLKLAQTDADYIKEATDATIESLWSAIILAIAIIVPFLGDFKATLITALSIPTSLLATFIIMAINGFNLETITLLALALVIGIIVDDAIVEVENISRHLERGKNPKTAALLATREIGLTVSASTLTIVAVFLPVALMGGTVGQFFKPFGLTVSASVLASLLVARTLAPVLAIYWLKIKKKNTEIKLSKTNKFFAQFALEKPYRKLLYWSLNHRKTVMIIALISLLLGIGLIPLIPKGFIPQLDRGEFNLVYTTPLPKFSAEMTQQQEQKPQNNDQNNEFAWLNQLSQTPEKLLLRKTRQVGEKLEEIVLKIPEVETVYNIAGGKGDPTRGVIYIKLKKERQLTTFEVQKKLREKLPKIKGVTTSVEDLQFIETESEKPLQIALLGTDINELIITGTKVKNEVEKLTGFADITVSGQQLNDNIPFEIERLNGQRVIYISANLQEGKSVGDATEQVINLTQTLLPNNIQLERWGNSAQSHSVLNSFGKTLILSVVFMLLFLLIPFGRLLEPLVIGLSLPLSVVGAMLALLITQSDFGMISLIGLIFLLGLLDKNAILLMDCANQLRQKGMDRQTALLETGVLRLRPILMTTLSTILGMLPIALGWGAGAELRQPMAVAIIGGLTTSSLLSLIVVPVIYTLLEDFWHKLTKK